MITTDQLTPASREGVADLLAVVDQHDGVSPLDEPARLALDAKEPREGLHHLLIQAAGDEGSGDQTIGDEAPSDQAPGDEPAGHETAGDESAGHETAGDESAAVVGYASLLADGTVQGMVHPDHRRRGHGTRLLHHVLELRPDAAVWSHGALPGALTFLEGEGLSVQRELLTLERPLQDGDPLPEARSTLEPLEVTGFDADRDAEDWVAVNAQAFADHPEQGGITLADLRRRMEQPWFDSQGFLLARHHGDLAGFVWTKREPGSDEGELYVVGTAPFAQGHGVARRLVVDALGYLAAQGARTSVLFVEADNTAAVNLYRRLGFTTRGRDVQLRREG